MTGDGLLYLLFLIGFPILWGTLCSKNAKKKGRNGVAWFFVGFFLGIIGLVISLCVSDETKKEPVVVVQPSLSPADELEKCKRLYEEGTISKEEFEELKKQILGI